MSTECPILPVDIVMDPSWWNKHAGITFDEDFFYHPAKRVESERKMAEGLYERWGQYGLGDKDASDLPVIGAVHLASGFLLQEMLGCEVRYSGDAPPLVVSANRGDLDISIDDAFSSDVFKKFDAMTESLKGRFFYALLNLPHFRLDSVDSDKVRDYVYLYCLGGGFVGLMGLNRFKFANLRFFCEILRFLLSLYGIIQFEFGFNQDLGLWF